MSDQTGHRRASRGAGHSNTSAYTDQLAWDDVLYDSITVLLVQWAYKLVKTGTNIS